MSALGLIERTAATPLTLGLVLFATALAAVPLGFVVLRVVGPRAPEHVEVPWNSLHALALALIAFVVLTGAGVILGEEWTVLTGLYLTVVALGVPAALAVALAIVLRPHGLPALGLRAAGHGRAVMAGIIAYVLVLPAWWGLGYLWTVVTEHYGFEVPTQEVMSGILELERSQLAQAILIAAVVGPLLEEILFRGFLQPLFIRRLGVFAGIAVTSFLFAILHGKEYVPPLFAIGVVLGVVRWRTGSLAAAWAVHGVHNGLMLFIALNFPEATDGLSSDR